VSAPPPLGAGERRALLAAAREAIAAHLCDRRPSLPAIEGALAEPGAVFVSLHRRSDGELRGCVGLLRAESPLVLAVARMAVAAATEDGRFAAVTTEELGGLAIEVSALSRLAAIRPDEIEVGRHGLLVRAGERRGVLLPRVAVDQGWDREAFLAQTCRKAGLAPDAWTRPETTIQGFTATVFSDADDGGPGAPAG
jgi:AmmeMemoRadiSam system protein A